MHSRRCRDLVAVATDALTAGGIELARPELPAKEQLRDWLRSEAPKHDCVLVMGGDGTVNMTLSVMQELGLPLGLLPAGTANDLARTLSVPLDIAEAAKVILAGTLREIDVAEVNGHPYVNAASFGLTSDITQQLDKKTKRRWGVLAYVMAAWRALRRARGFSATIRQPDGEARMRAIQLVVGNGRSFGGGMTVDAEARIDDGVLHMYAIYALPWWKVLLLLPALRMGTHADSQHTFNATGETFEIRTKRPIPVSADGEILTNTPATFSISAKPLRIYAPQSKVEDRPN
jgi:YegS/Rv2252/BmrU family lipid kinase